MSFLTTLKLTTAQQPAKMSAVKFRRTKLVVRLDEQIELAKAEQAGTIYAPPKMRTHKNKDTGVRTQYEVLKRVKPWWFVADNAKLALSVRYGAKVLELAKGKYAVEVADEKELLRVLDVVRTAVVNGELDAAIENAAAKLRDGFNK